TDIFGILLFIPPVHEIAWRFLKRRVNVSTDFVFTADPRKAGKRGPVIDLDANDYSSKPGAPDSPWKRFPEQ
ncbi:MAG: membrane protein FxsA, partial [Rhizobiaceae bacterium]|nr:membrane protein FxsA [Rhizobiaceae bacterium]